MILGTLGNRYRKYRKMYADLQKELNDFKEGLHISYDEFLKEVIQMSGRLYQVHQEFPQRTKTFLKEATIRNEGELLQPNYTSCQESQFEFSSFLTPMLVLCTILYLILANPREE